MALSLVQTTRKGSAHGGGMGGNGVRAAGSSPFGSDFPSTPTRGVLPGVMGASPFAVLASSPELPTSTSACPPAAGARSPATGRPGQGGLSLRRVNSSSSNNPLGLAASGGVASHAPAAAGVRRVGGTLRQLGIALVVLQIVLACGLLTRSSWFHKVTDVVKASPANLEFHPGKWLHAHHDQGRQIAAGHPHPRASGIAALMAGLHASRRERLWMDVDGAQKQQQQQQYQQQDATATVVAANPFTGTARPVHLLTSISPAVAAGAVSPADEATLMQGSGNVVTATDPKTASAASDVAAAGGAGSTAAKAAIKQGNVQTVATPGPTATSTTTSKAATAGEGKTITTAAATTTTANIKAVAKPTAAASIASGTVAKPAVVEVKHVGTPTAEFPPFAKPLARFAGRVANPPPIVGVIFYGRRDRVRILDCYLQRNMARNGGLLTEVVFVSATWKQEDVSFLDRLIAFRGKDYRKLIPERLDRGYTGHYAWMDPKTTYVKIDDDVVYIADDAIDQMLIAHNLNKYHLISANVVNHQPLELPHSQKGAHTQYEQTRPGDKSSWRPVMKPAASGMGTAAGALQPVPFMDNGWDVWGDWRRAANVHYSFLANYEAGRLGIYDFPSGEQLWDFNKHVGYIRWRINMIMFRASNIDVHVYNMSSTVGTYPGDDEDYITRILPQQLNRTSAAVSEALAVHFSFYVQRAGLENSTDLLDRYTLLAERTCGKLMPADLK